MRIWSQIKAVCPIIICSFIISSAAEAKTPLDDLTRNDFKKEMVLAQDTAKPTAEQQASEQSPQEDVVTMKAWLPQENAKDSAETAKSQVEDELFNQTITLHFKDADIQNVIRIMAAQTNINILMSEKDVKGKITVDLENVKLGPALDSVLRTNGLTYVKSEGIVRIIPLSQKVDEIERKLIRIPLNWVEAKKVKESLELKIGTASGGQSTAAKKMDEYVMNADEVSNSIIVYGAPNFLQQVQEIIAQIDVPEKQVMLEARMVDLTETARRDLGLSWNLYKLDDDGVSPARTTEVRYPDGSIDTEGQREYAIDDIAMATTHSSNPALAWSYGDNVSIFGKDYNLASYLSALEKRGLATTLHNPKVITLNNIEANIELVTQNPYTEAVQGQTGEFITNEVKFKDSGVKLKVKPYITNNGYIRMSINPEQLILTEVQYGIPVINSRKSTTNVIVKDEDTVSISGLRQLSANNNTDGIPWFHRIPVFGWLFKGTSNRQEKIENILFITPHIVKDPTLNTEQQLKYDQIDYNWELPDYFYEELNLRTKPRGWLEK